MITKIKEFFARDVVEVGRQKGIDLLKAMSIFFMVLCHLVLFVAEEGSIGFYLADTWFGSYLGVAHAFMLCMGVGMTFTRKNSSKDFILRGVSLLILGYVLNFLRSSIWCLIYHYDISLFMEQFLMNDILQFAGTANIVIGLLKKCKLKNIYILAIGVVLSIVGIFLPAIDLGNFYLNTFVGYFIPTYDSVELCSISTFSFINWFIFVGAGLVLGDIIHRVKDPDVVCEHLVACALPVGIAYLTAVTVLSLTKGIWYFNANTFTEIPSETGYYGLGFIDAIGLLGLDLGLIGAFHMLSKKFEFKFLNMTARNITVIYFIHWILNGFVIYALIAHFGIEFSMLQLYLIEIVIYLASAFLSIPLSKVFKKAKTLLKK